MIAVLIVSVLCVVVIACAGVMIAENINDRRRDEAFLEQLEDDWRRLDAHYSALADKHRYVDHRDVFDDEPGKRGDRKA